MSYLNTKKKSTLVCVTKIPLCIFILKEDEGIILKLSRTLGALPGTKYPP